MEVAPPDKLLTLLRLLPLLTRLHCLQHSHCLGEANKTLCIQWYIFSLDIYVALSSEQSPQTPAYASMQ